MADLGNIAQVTLPNGDVAHFKDESARNKLEYTNIAYCTCETAAATAAKKVTVVGNENWELQVGAVIGVRYSITNTASSVTLNVNSTGAKSIWYNNAVYTGTSGNICGYANRLTYYMYDGVYWVWIHCGTDTNSNTIGEYAGACTAGPFGMARYSLIMQVDESHWEGLVSTSGTGTSKVKNTNGFLLTTILYQNAGTYASGANAGQSGVWYTISAFDTRYSTNGGQFSAAGKPFYLVGTITDDRFYLKDTTWWANELPTEDDGYVYWYVGQFYSAYSCTLSPIHPIYDYIDGEWREIVECSRNAITVNGHTVDKDVPSNAVFTDTTYTFDTGDANGQIKVTPSGGTPQNVSVKGLAAGAYAGTYAGSDSAGGPANKVKGTAGTTSAYRHVWFSDSGYEDQRNYDDDFKYNPSTNSVKVSGAYVTYNSTTKSIDFTFD